ncbi:DUF1772 domain-containing protein [Rothia uropygialis]|uniref:DUF1772 domain-containing protein n=1 Tax=Kocuria sp. 36 TaxID=1415402 RepID=UPI00101BF24E|nr:DUF1772 domain-containing protein [Kocuria sp. 36]
MTHGEESAFREGAADYAQNSEAYPSNQKVRSHSGEGHTVSNLLTFIFCMILLVASFYCFGLWISDSKAWLPFAIAIVLYGLTFMVPLNILRGKTAKDSPGGKELTQL